MGLLKDGVKLVARKLQRKEERRDISLEIEPSLLLRKQEEDAYLVWREHPKGLGVGLDDLLEDGSNRLHGRDLRQR